VPVAEGLPRTERDQRRVLGQGQDAAVGAEGVPARVDRRAPRQLVASEAEDPLGRRVALDAPTVTSLHHDADDLGLHGADDLCGHARDVGRARVARLVAPRLSAARRSGPPLHSLPRHNACPSVDPQGAYQGI